MKKRRYPEGIEIILDDFYSCDWKTAIASSKREEYFSMWQSLSKLAEKAIDDKQFSHGKILWLFADACSMRLEPLSINEPFKPFLIMEDSRSALPEDFKQDEVSFFTEIVEEIDEPRLCARIADICWLLVKPRNPKYALLAIDSYREIRITFKGIECWDRAIRLCLMLKEGAGNRLKEIESYLFNALKKFGREDGKLALLIYKLLSKHCLAVDHRLEIAERLESLAGQFRDNNDLNNSRYYFDAAAASYKKLCSEEKFAKMIADSAECLVKEAINSQTSDNHSNIAAANLYEKAIQKYRNIPKAQRDKFDVDKKILELRTKLNESWKESLSKMRKSSSTPINIQKLVENSINEVRGKSTLDALASLSNIYYCGKVDSIRELCEKTLNEYPIRSIFQVTHLSNDGRVIAKTTGGETNESVIWGDMVKHYNEIEVLLAVKGSILPALEVVQQEHQLREIDFYFIVKRSSIVPEGRERLVAKALFAGYDNDFVTSLHFLIPQLEHLVRYHLKQNGVKTTNLDQNGIETENGLSTLAVLPEFEQMFGKDLAFEIRALFCDAFGPNLRNSLAHGLLDHAYMQSVYSIYAWWLGLRIVFNTFFNAKYSKDTNSNGTEDDRQNNG